MSRMACVMPEGCCRMRMKAARLTGSRRKAPSITPRALYSARKVRADRSLSPTVVW